MKAADQIALPLDWPQVGEQQRFILSEANRAAFEHFRNWSLWPVKATILTGPRRSGRSLLARGFIARVGGRLFDQAEAHDEEELFHAWNQAQETGRAMVMITDGEAPWPVNLPDLRTRLAVTPATRIAEPDDILFAALINLLFADRGLHIPAEAVKFITQRVHRDYVTAERVVEVLDTRSTVRQPENPVTEVTERGTLEFCDVGFAYPGAQRPVLCNLSFRVDAGTTTAIIGSTGAGKTTLVNLVSRLADATDGSVLVDGVDVRQLDLDLLWSKVGYVPQKPFLFSGTVASNLRYGRPDADEGELWEALEVAQASSFVQAMPDGIESPITQGGTNVSGGQRQRLCIARAMVVKPEIYVFDDSFSALDLATDARLRAALKPHTADAAVLIVAQRVSTIIDADQILVLEDGEIIGRGTHDELLETCPTYIEIVESQMGQGAVA